MLSRLPVAEYRPPLPGSSSTNVSQVRHPAHVFDWLGFEDEVLQWITANNELNERKKLEPPSFQVEGVDIGREVAELHPFVRVNLLNNATRCCDGCAFVPWTKSASGPSGEPDFEMRKDGLFAAPIEVKGKWTLKRADFAMDATPHEQAAIVQVYTYMRQTHRKYGILTSYDLTWFCRREICELCTGAVHEILCISRGIPASHTGDCRPHILQCFAYFSSVVTVNSMDSPPASTRTSPRASVMGRSTDARPLGSTQSPEGVPPWSNPADPSIEQSFDVGDLKVKSMLGYGRAVVGFEETFGVALKFADIWKHPEMLDELRNEAMIYGVLSLLQGIGIPRLKLVGHCQGLYCIGLTVHGQSPSSLNPTQKQEVVDTIDKIHALGVLHGDIRRENILVDEYGKVWVIDFGFARMNPNAEDLAEEQWQLERCLQAL